MTLAVERRDLLQQFDCLVCNELECIFFAENYSKSPKDLCEIIYQKVSAGAIKSMDLLQWEAKEVFMPTI